MSEAFVGGCCVFLLSRIQSLWVWGAMGMGCVYIPRNLEGPVWLEDSLPLLMMDPACLAQDPQRYACCVRGGEERNPAVCMLAVSNHLCVIVLVGDRGRGE